MAGKAKGERPRLLLMSHFLRGGVARLAPRNLDWSSGEGGGGVFVAWEGGISSYAVTPGKGYL